MFEFTIDDKVILVTGSTFDIKEELKKLGGRWNPEKRAWQILAIYDTEEVRNMLKDALAKKMVEKKNKAKEERDVARAKVVFANSPEGKKKAVLDALEKKNTTGQYWWVCCEDCEVRHWSEEITSCKVHGFRVGGAIFTGD